MRYDAAIIGAGANGLAAAAALAGAGLKTIVIERANACGGRAITREFHRGFRASAYCDEIAPIPADIFRALDLARHGAILVPVASSLALWRERQHESLKWTRCESWQRLTDAARDRMSHMQARVSADTLGRPERRWWRPAPDVAPWPGEDWSNLSLAELLGESMSADTCAHAMAATLGGRSADPFLNGSALHLLTPTGGGAFMGGLATLAGALTASARAAGAEISLGLEAGEVCLSGGRAAGVRLADGTGIAARAVISTLDLRRTFFSLFAWKDLPQATAQRVSAYRFGGGTARLLLALDGLTFLGRDLQQGPIHIAPGLGASASAHALWSDSIMPEHPPITLRCVSAADPGLAPPGKSVMTATIGCIPHHLFDGAWTNEKRSLLRERVLDAIEDVMPGTKGRILAADLILPPDIEDALGVTEGDLDGGEIAPDQMFAHRGFANCKGGRTPIGGLYLGGASSPAGVLGTCAAGIAAARAVMSDLTAGGLR